MWYVYIAYSWVSAHMCVYVLVYNCSCLCKWRSETGNRNLPVTHHPPSRLVLSIELQSTNFLGKYLTHLSPLPSPLMKF